jgi:hypothetical protein
LEREIGMTFHIALSSTAGSVMLSDSQGSTETSEMHGVQKQYIGEDLLVGGAGSSLVLTALFDALSARGEHDAAGLAAFIEDFFEREVRLNAMAQAEIVIVTPDADGRTVQRLMPGVLARFSRRAQMGLVGSGASFAARAVHRDRAIGVEWTMASLADLLAFAYDCADAANESLTVNDEFMLGFLVNGRAYAMGDEAIRPAHIPNRIQSKWGMVSNYYKQDILPIVRSIRDARCYAYRACSRLLAQEPDPDAREGIDEQLGSLAVS